ncbi:MAG: hypothetical protein ACTS3R_05510 [Inquilinaceae bacterium]
MSIRLRETIGRVARVRVSFRVFVVIWAALLAALFLVSLDARAAPPSSYNVDKLLHVGAYLVLGMAPLLFVASRPWAFLMAATLLPVGAGIEVLQDLAGGRSFSTGDIKANTLGVVLALGIGWIIRARFLPYRQS